MRTGTSNFLRLYVAIISIASIIGVTVALGVTLYQVGLHTLVSDEEYISARGSREIKACSPESGIGDKEEAAETIKTEEEIAACELQARQDLVFQRNYQFKEMLIGGIIRTILFLILFFLHYPRLQRLQEE